MSPENFLTEKYKIGLLSSMNIRGAIEKINMEMRTLEHVCITLDYEIKEHRELGKELNALCTEYRRMVRELSDKLFSKNEALTEE